MALALLNCKTINIAYNNNTHRSIVTVKVSCHTETNMTGQTARSSTRSICVRLSLSVWVEI